MTSALILEFNTTAKENDCRSSVSTAMIKHHGQKQCGEKRIYYTLQLSGHTPSPREASAGTQGRNLDAETEAEAKGGCCLQACSPWVATTYLPKDGTTPSGPGLPTSIINQENIN